MPGAVVQICRTFDPVTDSARSTRRCMASRGLAGLETPEVGSITFTDQTVFDSSKHVNVPAYKRKIGMVFQSYALWPNMTVLDTPQAVFDNPATDHVAEFIGMSNRLELHRVGTGWRTKAGVDVTIERQLPDVPAIVTRLWPDNVRLHHDVTEVQPHAVAISAHLLSSEFGGRHYDVTVAAGPEEFRLRADAALHGSWLRSAVEGAPVVISFRPDDMQAHTGPPHEGKMHDE
jgi:ABC-type Fe3+/spermidine/putrescine transport system ATPase subunit